MLGKLTCTSTLTSEQLKVEIIAVLSQERALHARFLELLAEVDRRKIYAALGFGSLFRYCTEYLGLSEQQAYLRISAARAGKAHPRVFEMIADGTTNMSALRVVATDLERVEDPGPILDEIAGKTKREVIELVGDAAGGHAERVMLVPVDSEHHQLFATVPNQVVELLGRVADLGGPTDPIEAIAEGLKLLVNKRWKTKMKGTYTKGRKVSGSTKRAVDARDEQRCTFVGEDGRRCCEPEPAGRSQDPGPTWSKQSRRPRRVPASVPRAQPLRGRTHPSELVSTAQRRPFERERLVRARTEAPERTGAFGLDREPRSADAPPTAAHGQSGPTFSTKPKPTGCGLTRHGCPTETNSVRDLGVGRGLLTLLRCRTPFASFSSVPAEPAPNRSPRGQHPRPV